MGSTPVALLFLVGLAFGLSPAIGYSRNVDELTMQKMLSRSDISEQQDLVPFRAGIEHTFMYDTQIASGLVPVEVSGEPEIPEQKAVTRIQAKVKIDFSSNRQASVRLAQIEIGQMNDHFPTPDKVKPMRYFQAVPISEENLRLLVLPVQIIYDDGVIERIKFDPLDEPWSKNIKRGVLNMVQLNLKRNNAQGLIKPQIMKDKTQLEDELDLVMTEGDEFSFVIPEKTVEGECQTFYTLTKAQSSPLSQTTLFNVTKSINYKLCRKIPDVAFGHEVEQIQPQTSADSQLKWHKQFQQRISSEPESNKMLDLQNTLEKGDPKEVKESKLDRSTVFRFELLGLPKRYAIKRVEVVSNYVYKNLKSETSGDFGSAMHAVVASQLVFLNAGPGMNTAARLIHVSPENDEGLVASNARVKDIKLYMMYGDKEMYGRNNPFKGTNKIVRAEQTLKKIARIVQKSHIDGIEAEAAIHLQRLVDVLRECSEAELQQIDQIAKTIQINSEFDRSGLSHGIEQLLADALAMAGSRNTIALLVELIMTEQIPENKAAQALKSLSVNLPAPSDSQVKLVLRLCQSEMVLRSEVLRQSCWLTVGGMIHETCQKQTTKTPQQSEVYGKQSGFISNEKCPLDKKQKYRETLINLFQSAQTTYDKVIALKAIGNAGLDIMIHDLHELISDIKEDRIIRLVAINMVRRLRNKMPRKIQTILLPIFLDNNEDPEVRMVAFLMTMETLPSKQVVSQIVFHMTRERSKHVRSFVYNTLKSIAEKPNPLQKEMSIIIRNAMKMVSIDEETLKTSGKKQIPIFSHEQGEGVFVDLISMFSSHSKIPTLAMARLDSMLNQDYQNNEIALTTIHRDIEQLYERLVHIYSRSSDTEEYWPIDKNYPRTDIRARRYGRIDDFDEERNTSPYKTHLKDLFTKFGFKSRRQFSSPLTPTTPNLHRGKWSSSARYDGVGEPMIMISLRVSDVDQAVLPVGRNVGPKFLRRIMEGQKPSFGQLVEFLLSLPFGGAMAANNKSFKRTLMALNLNEKHATIWTSAGVPLVASQSAPLIAFFEGNQANVHINREIGGGINTEQSEIIGDVKTRMSVHVHPAVTVSQMRRLSVLLPEILSTGVKSKRTIEFNGQLDAELLIENNKVQVKINVPRNLPKMRVFGLHTLPSTYVKQIDSKTHLIREPLVKGIHSPMLEPMYKQVDLVIGQTAGLKTHIRGHYYRPTEPTNYRQLVQMVMATENNIHVEFIPDERTPSQIILEATGSVFEKMKFLEPAFSKMFLDRPHDRRRPNTVFYENLDDEYRRMEQYVKSYRPTTMYSHTVKLTALTVGAPQETKLETLLQGACESNLRYCRMSFDLERISSPLVSGGSARQQYSWNTRMEMLRPMTVNALERINELPENDRKFTLSLVSEWGSDKKSYFDLKVLGEQAMMEQWQRMDETLESGEKSTLGDLEEDTIQTGRGYISLKQIPSYFPSSKMYGFDSNSKDQIILPSFLNKYTILSRSNYFDDEESDDESADRLQDKWSATQSDDYWTTRAWERMSDKMSDWTKTYGTTMAKSWLAPIVPRPVLHDLLDKMSWRDSTPRSSEYRNKLPRQLQLQMFVDPTTQMFANFRIRTNQDPEETFNLMPLRSKFQFLPLMVPKHQQFQQDRMNSDIRSMGKLLRGIEHGIRAECQADGNFVKTFDKVVYQSPISNCYSVLAKDCSSDEPEFVVLMKKRPDDMAQKRIKVVTQTKMIECEGRQDRVICKVDGQEVRESEDDSNVEFVDSMKSQVLIQIYGVSIRFDGKKAWIRISSQFKNGQCGLCGHYDSNPYDEWRMSDNELTSDLSKFHKSFSLQQDEECSPQYQQSFYQDKGKYIRLAPLGYENSMESKSALPIRSMDEEDEEEWKNQIKQSQNWMLMMDADRQQIGSDSSRTYWPHQHLEPRRIQPLLQTRIKELPEKVCFSKEPVETCPKGSYPISSRADLMDSSNIRMIDSASQQLKKVTFTCLERSMDLTKRLLSQARWGKVLDLSRSSPSFQEELVVETNCEQHF